MESLGIFSELTKGCNFSKSHKNKKNKVDVKTSKKPKGFFELINNNKAEQTQSIEKVDFAGNSDSLRKKFKIHVNGTDVPGLIKGFDDLESLTSFNSVCIENIHKNFQFKNLTPVQMQVIPAMMHERNVMVCAPTGSGKTLAFLLPVLHRLLRSNTAGHARALLVCPTKELAAQIYRICHLLLVKNEACQAVGKNNKPLNVQLLDKVNMKGCITKGLEHSRGWDLIISTPNSVAYLLKNKEPKIDLKHVEWLVVDESDKVFEVGAEEGKGFRSQLETIYTSCTNKKIKRAFFSATYAHDVEKWCIENLHNVLQVIIGGRSTSVDSVDQSLQYVSNEEGKVLAIREIIRQGFKPPALVFVQSKQRAENLYAELVYDNVRVDVIHGDKSDEEREQAIMKFRTAQTWVLICTDILGRGIDIKTCNLVINYDFPSSTESYIHRIGRTGRAGRKGKAVTFYTNKDKPLLRSIANIIKQQGGYVPEYLLNLKKISKEERKELANKQVKRKNVMKRTFTADEYVDKTERLQEKKLKKRKRRMERKKNKIAKLEKSETNVTNKNN